MDKKAAVLVFAFEIAVSTGLKFLPPLLPTCVTGGTVVVRADATVCDNSSERIRTLFKPTETRSTGGIFVALVR